MDWERQPNEDNEESIGRGYSDDDDEEGAYDADGMDTDFFPHGTPETSTSSPTCHSG